MILLSLEDPDDIALCGGGERIRDGTHQRKPLTVGSTKTKDEHDNWNTYGSDTSWVRVDGWGYMHRHHKGGSIVAKVWRRQGVKRNA